MESESVRQAANITPPRRGACLVITIDATAQAYDLQTIALGKAYNEDDSYTDAVFITLQAQTADVYYHFSESNSADIDETAAVSAGGALAFANTYSPVLVAGTEKDFRIVRAQDRYLVVKGSAAGKLRLYASSTPSP